MGPSVDNTSDKAMAELRLTCAAIDASFKAPLGQSIYAQLDEPPAPTPRPALRVIEGGRND